MVQIVSQRTFTEIPTYSMCFLKIFWGHCNTTLIKENHTKYDLMNQGPSTLLRIAFQLIQVSWKKPIPPFS